MVENNNRFRSDLNPNARVTLFPVVARWQTRGGHEELTWAGAEQIREAFAHQLFESWLPLLTPARDTAVPVMAWHRTQGNGRCLLRVVFDKDDIVATALLISQEDAGKIGQDPFLLLYGNVLPTVETSDFNALQVRIEDLATHAQALVARTFTEDEHELANTTCAGWAQTVDFGNSPRFEAPGPRELQLTALYLWPHLAEEAREQSNLVVTAGGTLQPDYLAPRLNLCVGDEVGSPAWPRPQLDIDETDIISLHANPTTTAQLLSELRLSSALPNSDIVPPVEASNNAHDIGGYRHLLDHLVCGLEPRITETEPSIVLDLLLAYSPANHHIAEADEGWAVFEDAIQDIMKVAQIGSDDTASRTWLAAAATHNDRDGLLEIGLAEAIGRQLAQVCQGSFQQYIEHLLRDESLRDLAKDERRWLRDLVSRVCFAADGYRAKGPQQSEPLAPSDPTMKVKRQNGDERRKAVMADSVQAIQSLLQATAGTGIHHARPRGRATAASIEERAINSWRLAPTTSLVIWESLGGGDAHGALAAAVHSIRSTEASAPHTLNTVPSTDAHPVALSVHGPAGSVSRLETAIAAIGDTQERQSHKPGSTKQPTLEEISYDNAGIAIRCSAVNNIWARARTAHGSRRGAGSTAGATLVAPSGGLPRWPELWSRTRGVVFVLDAKRILHEPRAVRMEVAQRLEEWRRSEISQPRVAIVLTGCDQIDDPDMQPLRSALDTAFDQLASQRNTQLSDGLVSGLIQLGALTLSAIGGDFLAEAFAESGLSPEFFALPSPQAAKSQPLHDLPLVWLLQEVGVRLNLNKRRKTRPKRAAAAA
jgi:hypothetical protein